MGEIVGILLWASLLVPALVTLDALSLFFSRSTPALGWQPPRIQWWIQDFVILAIDSGGMLAWAFHSLEKPEVSRVPVPGMLIYLGAHLLEMILAFFIATDICSMWPQIDSKERALMFAIILCMSIFALWFTSIIWFIAKRIIALRRGPRFVTPRIRLFACIAALGYGTAFFLPMATVRGSMIGGMTGYEAYMICLTGFFSHEFAFAAVAWSANAMFWAAFAFLLEGRRGLSVLLTAAALLAALTVHEPNVAVYNSPGYGMWFFSMASLGIFALIDLALVRKSKIDNQKS